MSRREKLQALLSDDPDDVFLLYGLACEEVKEGDVSAGLERFQQIHQRFPDYVAAWFKHAQLLAEAGESDQARAIGEQGLAAARRAGDGHALGEIAGFLELL